GNVFRNVRNKPLPSVAKDLDCTSWAQLLLKYVLSHPAVTCAIPGTRQPSHMRENAIAGASSSLSANHRKLILDAFFA
ncbi:MAG: aldo/keto reductase, partial [Bacteroidota bacterium]